MNLQPLYDVKERLEAAAIAGTGLLGEDFRLARAAENLKPLAAASPVFAKINAGLAKLLAAPAQERPGLLLDLLALVDAVAYTQGKTGMDGELSPLPAGAGVYRQISYGQISPLLAALTSTGGGRMEIIQSAWKNHPEFFSDFRVLPAVVAGLGDSYGEIADLNAAILERIGRAALPLLKQDFDPVGKKEMARRVQIIDEIAGAAENEWYLAQLPKAKKLIRQTLLLALRRDTANAPLLAELSETEKADCRLAARFALARMEAPGARAYLETLGGKDRIAALDVMRCSRTRAAGDLAAEWFIEAMEAAQKSPSQPLDADSFLLLDRLRAALECKTGALPEEAYRRAAAVGTVLDREYSFEQNGRSKREPMLFYCMGASNSAGGRRYFSAAMPVTLLRSIQFTRDAGLCALAGELAGTYGGAWAAPALCASLLTEDSAAAGRRLKELVRPRPKLFSKRAGVDGRAVLRDALWAFYRNGENGRYEYMLYENDPADSVKAYYRREAHPAAGEALDPIWFDVLMETGGLDQNLINLLPDKNAPDLKKVGKFLYAQVTHSQAKNAYAAYVNALIKCGWQDWDDFYVKCAQAWGEVWYYGVRTELNLLPVSGKEKAAQLRKVTDLIWQKRLKARSGTWPDERIRQMIAEWENEGSSD